MQYTSLIFSDLKNIRRDPMLMMVTIAPIIITALILFGFPALAELLRAKLNFNLDTFYPFACVVMLPLIPMMFGMVYGFMLLDERDENMLAYFSVTPLGKTGYLKMRMLAPVIFSFIFLLFFIWMTNFDSGLIWWKHIPLALITSLQAPIMLLFLGAFAENKVEGMAIAKGFGILLLAMPIDYFIPSHWTFIAGLSPLFWTARGFLAHDVFSILIYSFAALVVHVLFLLLLGKKFNQIEK
jgi:fluoroquinolone transport system permease protein